MRGGVSKTLNVTQKGGSLKNKPCKFVFNGAIFAGIIVDDATVNGKRTTIVNLIAPNIIGTNYWGVYGGHIGFKEIAGVTATGDELATFTKIYDYSYYQSYNIAKNPNNHDLYGYANNFDADVLCDFLHEAWFNFNNNEGIILTDDNKDNTLIVTLDLGISALSIGGQIFVGLINSSKALQLVANGPAPNSHESNILLRDGNINQFNFLDFLTLDNSTKVDIRANGNLLSSICFIYATPSPSVDTQLQRYADTVAGGTNKPLKMIFNGSNLNILLVTKTAI